MSGRAKRETAKGRNRTRNAHFRRSLQIFSWLCKSRDLGVADLRRKPQEAADFRRKPQKTADFCRSRFLPFAVSLLARSYNGPFADLNGALPDFVPRGRFTSRKSTGRQPIKISLLIRGIQRFLMLRLQIRPPCTGLRNPKWGKEGCGVKNPHFSGREKAHKHKLFALVNVQMPLGQTAGRPRVNRAKKFMCSPRNTGNINFSLWLTVGLSQGSPDFQKVYVFKVYVPFSCPNFPSPQKRDFESKKNH